MDKKKDTPIKKLNELFPNIIWIDKALKKDPSLIHASNIIQKADVCSRKKNAEKQREELNILIPYYIKYLQNQQKLSVANVDYYSRTDKDLELIKNQIEGRVSLLNKYYQFFEDNFIEGKEGFDSRSKIRSTVLEEFMSLLFSDFVNYIEQRSAVKKGTIKNGASEAYSNLFFTSTDLLSFIKDPSFELNTKRQDYSIFREVNISIKGAKDSKRIANIPLLAIENKTYLDKTMLEGAVATAEKIKIGAPYSTYVIATETYAVKYGVDPISSRIDQIFVLRKCKADNKNRIPNPIDSNVVINMFWYIVNRLIRPWSKIEERVIRSGVVI